MYGPPWTKEQDAILLRIGSCSEAARVLGKSREACVSRMRRLKHPPKQPRVFWQPEEDAILLSAPSLVVAAAMLKRSRQACSDRRLKICPELRPATPKPEDFLTALRRLETPPTDVPVKDRQPLMRNPSLFVADGGASSISMD